jgi:hypothetical protein
MQNLCDSFFPPFSAHGNLANVSLEAIPEAGRGMQVLREWLREFFFHLHPPTTTFGCTHGGFGSSEFISVVIKAAALAFILDNTSAKNYLQFSPAVALGNRRVSPMLYRNNGLAYIVHDVLTFLDGSDQTHVVCGCLFLL